MLGFIPTDRSIRPIRIGDFKRVERKLLGHEPGEVAHIENIMKGEYKEREFVHLRRKEETNFLLNEQETMKERDTTSTERHELETEASAIASSATSLQLGATLSGGFGPVQVGLSASYSSSSAREESNRQAERTAREITERAVERVATRVRQERTTKTIEEITETHRHGLDNRGGDGPVVGVYRWVDKVYEARLVNYGKRLMFEFMVAEPSAFHRWATTNPSPESIVSGISMPLAPDSQDFANAITSALPAGSAATITTIRSFKDITRENFAFYAAAYGAQVEPPPAHTITVSKAFAGRSDSSGAVRDLIKESNDLVIPDGYQASSVHLVPSIPGDGSWFTVLVGNKGAGFGTTWMPPTILPAAGEIKTIAVSIHGAASTWVLNINIVCELSPATFDAWQIKAYQAIIDAYNSKKAAYEQAIEQAKKSIGATDFGNNPGDNQRIMREAFKRGGLRWLFRGDAGYLTWQVWYGGWGPQATTTAEISQQLETIAAVEQMFDWDLMAYELFPFYYRPADRHKILYLSQDNDPEFTKFLQAGAAKVIVPVRPGNERSALYLLQTGTVGTGNLDLPIFEGSIGEAIASEFGQQVDENGEYLYSHTGDPVQVGDSWLLRVPTTLTILQNPTGPLQDTQLPEQRGGVTAIGSGTAYSLQNLTPSAA